MGVSGRWSSSVLARRRAKVVVSAALFGALIVLLLPGNSVRAVAGAASAPLAAVAGSPATLTLRLGRDTVTADGTSRDDVAATVVDANNNPVSGDLVTFSTSGDVTFDSTQVTTNTNGVGFTHLTASTTPGAETITATEATA